MALSIAEGTILEARLEYRGPANQIAFNILHYAASSVIKTAQPGQQTSVDMVEAGPEIANQIFQTLSGIWQPAASDECQMTGVTVKALYPLPLGRNYTYVPAIPVSGTETTEPLPLQDTVTLVKKTAFAGRREVGRLFFVGLVEGQQSGGIVNPAAVSEINAFGNSLVADLDIATDDFVINLYPCLWHTVPNEPAVIHRVIECQMGDNRVKSQRRRRVGNGM